jgi:hypothetical protein
MDVIIKKGSHYSSGFSLSGMHIGRTSMSFKVTFDSNCLVLPGRSDCDGDTNKLFGWSYGIHQLNSIRVGWKARDGRIRLVAYMYENGGLRMKGFAWADVNTPITISINYSTDTNYVTFDAGGTMYSTQWFGANPMIGYNLKPYFGGNCPAPIDMRITME